MSLVTIDRRESSGTKFETYANFGCFVESGPEEESLKSRNQELLHHNLLPCNYLLSCVCLLFPTHYFDNSIVKQIHPVAINSNAFFYLSLRHACYSVDQGVVA